MNNLFSVQNKVIFITGGAGLLGMEYARFLGSEGARVVLFDNCQGEILERKLASLRNIPNAPPMGIRGDITDPESVKNAVEKTFAVYGQIDVLINNAAVNPAPGDPASKDRWKPYEEYPLDLWKKEIDVGLTGMLIVTQEIVPHMIGKKQGSIINISSIYGITAPDPRIYGEHGFKSIAYATIKSGVLNFTRAWAARLAETGVRTNTLTLGGVYAGQDAKFTKKYSAHTMLARMARPDEYNGAILFLSSDASSYMTGANLIIDGGWTAW